MEGRRITFCNRTPGAPGEPWRWRSSASRPLADGAIQYGYVVSAQRKYRRVFSAVKQNSPWNSDSDEDFLYHIGAVAKGHDGMLHPTRAGLLAFGFEYEITSYIPQFLLDYREETSGDIRWEDRVCSESGDWSGNIIDFFSSFREADSSLQVPLLHERNGHEAWVQESGY